MSGAGGTVLALVDSILTVWGLDRCLGRLGANALKKRYALSCWRPSEL